MISALVAAAVVFVYVWSDGIHRCQDGDRYTSGKLQPTPFNRRCCSWPPRLLMWISWTSFVAIASTLGGWKQSLLFITLSGVAFCVNLPTTTDGPAMLLSWLSSIAWTAGHPALALGLSLLAGLIHERAPVFAALYAWHPALALGLVAPAIAAWVKGAAPKPINPTEAADKLVGHGLFGAIAAHRDFVNLLSPSGLVWSLRGLPVMAAYLGVSVQAWVCLGVAFASRIMGTDTSRYIMWGALPMIRELGDVPLWMLAVQVISFRRCGQ